MNGKWTTLSTVDDKNISRSLTYKFVTTEKIKNIFSSSIASTLIEITAAKDVFLIMKMDCRWHWSVINNFSRHEGFFFLFQLNLGSYNWIVKFPSFNFVCFSFHYISLISISQQKRRQIYQLYGTYITYRFQTAHEKMKERLMSIRESFIKQIFTDSRQLHSILCECWEKNERRRRHGISNFRVRSLMLVFNTCILTVKGNIVIFCWKCLTLMSSIVSKGCKRWAFISSVASHFHLFTFRFASMLFSKFRNNKLARV